MNHKDVIPLRTDSNVTTGFFAKPGDADEEAFGRAVSKKYWAFLRHSTKPPLKERTESEMAALITSVARRQNLRFNPSSKRYVEADDDGAGAFEAFVAYTRDLVAKSREELRVEEASGDEEEAEASTDSGGGDSLQEG